MKAILLLLTLTAAAFAQPSAPIKDSRDGKTYRAVKIGKQVWMAENLNYAAEGSKCYDNDPANCDEYGRLYDWETALKSCPAGWHLPNNAEWDRLYKYVDNSYKANYKELYGESETAGKHLKTKEFNGLDTYGFAALSGGFGYSNGNFNYTSSYWWSASVDNDNAGNAYGRSMNYNSDSAGHGSIYKSSAFSVRCVRD